MAIRKLLEDDLNWGQGFDAQDMSGQPIATLSRQACKWTLMGAIVKQVPHLTSSYEQSVQNRELQGEVMRMLGFSHAFDLREFNDQSTHAEVLAHIDAAIAGKIKPAKPIFEIGRTQRTYSHRR